MVRNENQRDQGNNVTEVRTYSLHIFSDKPQSALSRCFSVRQWYTKDCHKIIIVVVLFMVVCAPRSVRAAERCCKGLRTQQTHSDNFEVLLTCHCLRDALRDKERSQQLLRDRALMHNILKQCELRQEILRHPRFVRQMMQIREIRQELLQNETMMLEMLKNRDIHGEINRNREMVEEIEKNETYRQENLEQQADILEELLLDSTISGALAPNPSCCQ